VNFWIEARGFACFDRTMSTILIEIRRAKVNEAGAIADAHDSAWRIAYQGIIPGPELEKLINRRGPAWWERAIRKGGRIALFQFGDKIAGYANYGPNRTRSLHFGGEIYELYMRPEFQGVGFGHRLFTAARRDLAQNALKSLIVWTLSENEKAVEFYRALGGTAVAHSSQKFGTRVLDKVAFGWQG
jgi:ribosomal protein S18 acetylase RimI-like enzyme